MENLLSFIFGLLTLNFVLIGPSLLKFSSDSIVKLHWLILSQTFFKFFTFHQWLLPSQSRLQKYRFLHRFWKRCFGSVQKLQEVLSKPMWICLFSTVPSLCFHSALFSCSASVNWYEPCSVHHPKHLIRSTSKNLCTKKAPSSYHQFHLLSQFVT
jgi:hypothetical protein